MLPQNGEKGFYPQEWGPKKCALPRMWSRDSTCRNRVLENILSKKWSRGFIFRNEPQKVRSLGMGSRDSTPGMGPQKICSSFLRSRDSTPEMGPRNCSPPRMGSRDFISRNGALESVLPKELGARILPPGMGPQKLCSPFL